MWWWWWAWIVFIVVVLFLPWSYGWGRRGWGPPYPTYYRRRTYARGASATAEPGDVDPYDPTVAPMGDRVDERDLLDERAASERYPGYGWTWLADLLWLAVLAAIGWGFYLWVT